MPPKTTDAKQPGVQGECEAAPPLLDEELLNVYDSTGAVIDAARGGRPRRPAWRWGR